MNISKKVPIIVSVVLVLLWGFLGFRSAMRLHGTAADPAIIRQVTITEDISVINRNEVYDADLEGKDYDHTTIPAGSAGEAWIFYGHRDQIINDPETDIHIFTVSFYLGENSIRTHFSTGPESQLGQGKISIKKIENYQEIISDPSYTDQAVVMSYPLIGNYGVIPADFETDAPVLKGYIVREWCQAPSNFRSEGELDTFLREAHFFRFILVVDIIYYVCKHFCIDL